MDCWAARQEAAINSFLVQCVKKIGTDWSPLIPFLFHHARIHAVVPKYQFPICGRRRFVSSWLRAHRSFSLLSWIKYSSLIQIVHRFQFSGAVATPICSLSINDSTIRGIYIIFLIMLRLLVFYRWIAGTSALFNNCQLMQIFIYFQRCQSQRRNIHIFFRD